MYIYLIIIVLLSAYYFLWSNRKTSDVIVNVGVYTLFELMVQFFKGSSRPQFTQLMYNSYKNKRQFSKLNLFIQSIYMPTNLEMVKNVMVKDFQYFQDRDFFVDEENDPMSATLFAISGEKWKQYRAHISQCFSLNKMKRTVPMINEVCEHLNDAVEERIKINAVIDVKELMAKVVTDVLVKFVFSIECNTLRNKDDGFQLISRTSLPGFFFAGKALLFLRIMKLSKIFSIKIHSKTLTNFCLSIMNDLIDYRKKTGEERDDIAGKLINFKRPTYSDTHKDTKGEFESLSLNEMTSQSFSHISAGLEATSQELMFLLYELARNPEVQELARENVKCATANHDGQFSYEALAEMTYLEQCVNEALRKYPPVYIVSRKVERDYLVPNSKEFLEKGACVLMFVYAIHHDPEFYPDPEKFDPDRFLLENVKNRNPYSFLPFGTGPRVCIGYNLAILKSKIIVGTLLMNYKISLTTQKPIEFKKKDMILTPVKLDLLFQRI